MKNRQVYGWPTILPLVEEHTNEEDKPSNGMYEEYKVDSPLIVERDRELRVLCKHNCQI